MFPNVTQIVKNKLLFNNCEQIRMALYCNKKLPTLLRGITSKHLGGLYCLICLYSLATKNLNPIKKYVKIKTLNV